MHKAVFTFDDFIEKYVPRFIRCMICHKSVMKEKAERISKHWYCKEDAEFVKEEERIDEWV